MPIHPLRKTVLRLGLLAAVASTTIPYAQADEGTQALEELKVKVKLSMRGIYDYPPHKAAPSFVSAKIPKYEEQGQQFLNFTLGSLGLDLEKKAPFVGNSTIKGVLNAGLDKEKGVTLRKVYVEHKCFLVGLHATNLFDADASLNTLTGDAPCSMVASSVTQVRWKHQLCKGFSFALGVEEAKQLALSRERGKQKKCTLDRNIPAASASFKCTQKLGHVRLGGLFRAVDYHIQPEEKKQAEQKYLYTGGVNLTGALKVIPNMTTIKLQAIYGQGIGQYIVDKVHDAYNNNKAELASITTMGGYVGIEQQWLPQLSSTLAYGILDAEKIDNCPQDAYQQGHYASVNLMYQPVAQTTLGIEYQWGRRQSVKKEDIRDAHRLQAAVSFKI